MRNLSLIWVAILIASGFVSCKTDKTTKPSATGKPNEIIVICEDNLWKSSLGDTVRNFFANDRIGLPQPEPLYKPVQIKLDEFNRVFQTHRNVLNLLIDSTLTKARYEMGYNVYSRPQIVIKLSAPTIEMLKEEFTNRSREIFNLYENADIRRLQDMYASSKNAKATELVRNKFNISMNIPADYFVAVNKENFVWLRKEANILSQGILIYSYPYTDTNAYNIRKIISVRNQFTSLYVPGSLDSSYMVVAENYIKPVTRTLELKNELAIETRALWDVEKDFMGGPFISYTLVDKKNNMVLTLDGYVYAPNKDKAGLLKEVQSILLTFDFIDK